ncbi:hypothetical protein AK812_SmicGene16495 [Symbiodinium microadriaticum]|uniref:C3H1-type domain-containing protein n=1 Tax=Symbiodinium microadriaticum TaxID=2951 RepID=A0A1Q9E055_SYMMI|nr:hypothetical protein AK812_SmicGene16495 [Symbiodinium microadriaticum]
MRFRLQLVRLKRIGPMGADDKVFSQGEPPSLHLSPSFMTQATSVESTLDDASSRDEDFDQSHPEISNFKLVFSTLERGLPSLHRGWRTPDPSPVRRGLPKCAPYAELLEERSPQEEVMEKAQPRGCHPATAEDEVQTPNTGMRFQTPSPEPQMPVPPAPANVFPPLDHSLLANLQTRRDQSFKVSEAGHGTKFIQSNWCVSIGSQGHPFSCAAPCKYYAKAKGCKDGANCDHCHLCRWKKHATRPVPDNQEQQCQLHVQSSRTGYDYAK